MKHFVCAVFLAFGASALAAPTIKPALLPMRADAPVLFVPLGWKIEKLVTGDLNADKLEDCALVLIEDKPAKTADGTATSRHRALLMLLREGKGLKRAGFSDKILVGTRDGGAFWGTAETPVKVGIKRGILHVTQETGSREIAITTQKLRFDARQNRFLLIGMEASERDRLTGETLSYSANYLTGRAIRKTTGAHGRTFSENSQVSRVLKSLESIQSDDRLVFQS